MAAQKHTVRFGPFQDYIPEGVRVGDTIYLSGQVAVDAEGAPVGVGDLAAQLRQAYAHVAEALDRFGAVMTDVVDEMWLVTDMNDAMGRIEDLFAIRHEAYAGQPDVAQTMVEVAGLVMPELLIEVKCVARV